MTAVVARSPPPQSSLAVWKKENQEKWEQRDQNVQAEVRRVEAQLRHILQKKQIRVSEFFRDFDPLRSGYITTLQFRSCLSENFGLNFSDEDFGYLAYKYENKEGKINYMAFQDSMQNAFNPKFLDGQPNSQIQNFQSTALPPRYSLTQEHLTLTNNILIRCHEYYKGRGISIKGCYGDFDRHHRGFVTESQFHRSFPGPPGITPEEISALAQRYLDPSNGLCNYLKFNDDVMNVGGSGESTSGIAHYLAKEKVPPAPSIEVLLERIKNGIYKKGVRTTEFFRDFDKLRSGLITEKQFLSCLSICCDKVTYLTPLEAQIVVDHYKTPDGRVRYTQFCHSMEHAYNEPELEKKPTTDVYRPLRGHLLRPLNEMSSAEEEQRVADILQRLKAEVKRRSLLLHPFFNDFDKGKGFTRGVTKPQFERILHFLSLDLTAEEIKLLEKKFEAGNGLDINYTAFTQIVDQEYTGQVMEEAKEISSPRANGGVVQPLPPGELEMLVLRLREHVQRNRLRVAEYFQDADPLRVNSITPSRFRQGLSSLGKALLSDSEFQSLCKLFSDPKRDGHVQWKDFVSAMEDPILESAVSIPVPVPLPSLRTGAVDFSTHASPEDQKCLDDVLYRFSEKIRLRRILAKPVFQDYDWHHMGYVTSSQFKQCLMYLALEASESELEVLNARFSDAMGFNYLRFLEIVDPKEQLEDKYRSRAILIKSSKESMVESSPSGDLSALSKTLEKIKIKVCKERMRIYEFMKDYDKLRSGRVSRSNFARGLDLCGFQLSPDEVTMLLNRYTYPADPNFVNYMMFSDEIESVFTTKGLEKTPLAEVDVFKPPGEVGKCPLTSEERTIFDTAMQKVAEKVRARRIQLYPLFEDYDRLHNGNVTKTQFQRVLSELELAGLVSPQEFNILFKKFEIKIGGRLDINYITFCETCYHYAKMQSQ